MARIQPALEFTRPTSMLDLTAVRRVMHHGCNAPLLLPPEGGEKKVNSAPLSWPLCSGTGYELGANALLPPSGGVRGGHCSREVPKSSSGARSSALIPSAQQSARHDLGLDLRGAFEDV